MLSFHSDFGQACEEALQFMLFLPLDIYKLMGEKKLAFGKDETSGVRYPCWLTGMVSKIYKIQYFRKVICF